jgi:acyl-CoA synthetase (AMP-forming)/AMP-acid ligase II
MKEPTWARHHLSQVGGGQAPPAVRDIWASVLHACTDGTHRRHAPTGEVAVGPRHHYATFGGDCKHAQATVDARRGLWHHTGDFGRKDADGQLYFVDRTMDSLRPRAENVSCLELKTAIERQPDVAEVAVHPVHATDVVLDPRARRAARASR